MNGSHHVLGLAAIAAGTLVLAGCRTPGPSAPATRFSAAGRDGEPARDPRLDDLGLVYDDTIITTSALVSRSGVR